MGHTMCSENQTKSPGALMRTTVKNLCAPLNIEVFIINQLFNVSIVAELSTIPAVLVATGRGVIYALCLGRITCCRRMFCTVG